ncbi:MAG: DUF5996 family protein [Bacteriovoracia bacterium]
MEISWPHLDYQEWKPTYETLHRWLQIVGKLRLCKSPWLNHSWHSTFYVTSRGLTTSAIPLGERNLTVEFDFIDHQLIFQDSLGKSLVMVLQNESVASFYERFQDALRFLEVDTTFSPFPNEVSDATPFYEDLHHKNYEQLDAHNCFQALVRIANVFEDFRADFIGKSSPVHFFWGSFDLAVTRFSGRRAPEHPGGVQHLSDEVVREAYSHEVMSCGFWPGNEVYPHAAFYAYAYPEPQDFSKARLYPAEAFYHPELQEFILDYEVVRKSDNPHALLRSFLQSAYETVADLSHWERDVLERSNPLERVRAIAQSSFGDRAIRQ